MVDVNRRPPNSAHSPSAKRLWEKLTMLRQRLFMGMEEGLSALSALDLTVPQSMALFRLVERGPLTISELQKVTGRSQAATSHLVTQLERQRLVSRKADPTDGRCTRVLATNKGMAWVREVEALRLQGFEKALASIPTPVVRQLEESVSAVLAAMVRK